MVLRYIAGEHGFITKAFRSGESMNAKSIQKVLVIGAGAMGEGIAQQMAQAGLQVLQVDMDNVALSRCAQQMASNLAQLEKYSLVSETPSTILGRITARHIHRPAEAAELAEEVEFIIEAIPEILELKQDLFSALDRCSPDRILASNTSTLSITEISQGMQWPSRVVGVHFFYPAHIVPLVEVHGGQHTSGATIESARELMVRLGKEPIAIRKVMPGFIINRMQAAFNREVLYMLEQGVATAEELDLAAKACFGFRLACLGPLEIHDLNGLDVVLNSWRQTRPTLCNDREPPQQIAQKVAHGQLGAKTGKGWYDYHGASRETILARSNEKLLRQLALFKSQQQPPKI
jgi:3-hydroxybutyryl-CoA dehydrogenase